MAQAGIFALDPSHIGFAHDMVSWVNKARINLPTVCHVEVTLPTGNNIPQEFKCF
jgi:hypothetical protein